jgi:hypothetical protein
LCDILGNGDAFRLEGAEDGGIVNEVAEDRERAGVGVLERQRDGVANAETHAEMGGSEDPHSFTMQSIREFRPMGKFSGRKACVYDPNFVW